jgi:hypothetical protein
MSIYGLRKRKVKEVPQEEEEVEEKVTKKRVKTSTKKSRAKEEPVEQVVTSNEPDLDLTKTCPNEVCNFINKNYGMNINTFIADHSSHSLISYVQRSVRHILWYVSLLFSDHLIGIYYHYQTSVGCPSVIVENCGACSAAKCVGLYLLKIKR